jgi:hypothetical protein
MKWLDRRTVGIIKSSILDKNSMNDNKGINKKIKIKNPIPILKYGF